MRKLLLLIVLSLVSHQAQAAFVQAAASGGGSATTQTCVYGSNVTAGDLLIVGTKSNGPTVSSVADTRGTTWTTDQASASIGFYHGVATSSGANTVTVTMSFSQFAVAVCLEYSVKTLLDVFVAGGSASTSAPITTTKAVTTIVLIAGDGATLTLSGVTTRVTGIMLTGPNGDLAAGDVDETSIGTYTPTTSSASNNARASFAPATSGVPRHR